MKINFSTKLVLILSLIVMLSWLASYGCKSRISGPQTPSAQINVSSRQIAYGNVVLNNSTDQTVSVQNTGSIGLNIGLIAQAKPLLEPFSIVNDNCSGKALPASGTCTLQVRFSPMSQGAFIDSFDIPSDASNENPVTISVSGNGKALRVAINQVKIASCPSLELLVTVTSGTNLVSGLTPSNFHLLENGLLISGLSVTLASPAPVSISLVMDYSTSLQNQVTDMETAAKNIIGTMVSGDEAAIIKFATAIVVPPTFGDMTSALNEINTPYAGDRNETHLYDAVMAAIDETGANPGSTRAVVVISDGRDSNSTNTGPGSTHTLSQVIADANEKNIAIFTIGLGNVDGGIMSQLAAGTGGQYFYAQNVSLLNYPAIKNILSGQYSLTYQSSLQGSIMLDLAVDSNGDQGEVSRQVQGCP